MCFVKSNRRVILLRICELNQVQRIRNITVFIGLFQKANVDQWVNPEFFSQIDQTLKVPCLGVHAFTDEEKLPVRLSLLNYIGATFVPIRIIFNWRHCLILLRETKCGKRRNCTITAI